ncbi:caspase family protein [Romeria aff. gracilis LEGE 07310]|uniref:Caspase family protein n=1 Tax=Vasconcelosia minhoensis LEGE 07310 TaxID=915328 RepID=A0A8J7DN80_9CYAN|nr:caspase family protein [Romeria gracilis]MBE9079881.1 caspase family protein [Romeria aff. gracilis LEGE 07310]
MSRMKRRHFLQFAGSSLAALGLSQLDFLTQADRYGRVLAQSTPRKLALLVGINDYDFANADLQGCLTDVELQYELLVNRFGFNPVDIVKVADNEDLQPNRETILRVFQEHLVEQVKPGDVVVFHYSGHGSRVLDPNPVYEGSEFNGTIVPNDPLPEIEAGPGELIVPDIMGRTLFLLMRSVQTDNLTAILDSCHSGGGLRGNTIVRAAPERTSRGSMTLKAVQTEFDFQEQLRSKLDLSDDDFQAARQAGVARGLGIGSAQFSELAQDMAFNGFHAGAFTYLMTRYLWQMTGGTSASAVQVALERSTRAAAATRDRAQVPKFQAAPGSNGEQQPIYFTAPLKGPAEAVVTNVTGEEIEFWLGGVSPQFLDLSEGEAVFTVLGDNREPLGEIVYKGRTGLSGYGQPVTGSSAEIEVGMFLREKVVGLPPNPQLIIGVDPSLGEDVALAQTELNAALVSEQTGQSRIAASPVDQETAFDYLIGRMTPDYAQQIAEDYDNVEVPPVGRILLFTPTLELVAESFGQVDESVRGAVVRLKARLKALLANKLLASLAGTTTELRVEGEIFSANRNGARLPFGQPQGQSRELSRTLTSTIEPFQSGENIQIRVANHHSDQALYLSCIVIGSDGSMTVIYPTQWDAPDDAALVSPNSELVIPQSGDSPFQVCGSGYFEILTLMSTGSLRNALRGLQEIAAARGTTRGNLALEGDQSLEVLNELLGDVDSLSRGTRGAGLNTAVSSNRTAVDGRAIAAFSSVLEVAETNAGVTECGTA